MNRAEKRRKERQIKKKLLLENEERPKIEVETADEKFDKLYGGHYTIPLECDFGEIMKLMEENGIRFREEK